MHYRVGLAHSKLRDPDSVNEGLPWASCKTSMEARGTAEGGEKRAVPLFFTFCCKKQNYGASCTASVEFFLLAIVHRSKQIRPATTGPPLHTP